MTALRHQWFSLPCFDQKHPLTQTGSPPSVLHPFVLETDFLIFAGRLNVWQPAQQETQSVHTSAEIANITEGYHGNSVREWDWGCSKTSLSLLLATLCNPIQTEGPCVWLIYVFSANKASYFNRQWHWFYFYLKKIYSFLFLSQLMMCSINDRLSELMADSSNTPKEVGIFGSKVGATLTIYAIQFDSPINRINRHWVKAMHYTIFNHLVCCFVSFKYCTDSIAQLLLVHILLYLHI